MCRKIGVKPSWLMPRRSAWNMIARESFALFLIKDIDASIVYIDGQRLAINSAMQELKSLVKLEQGKVI